LGEVQPTPHRHVGDIPATEMTYIVSGGR